VAKKSAASLYSPHPAILYIRSVIAAMERKTGKTFDEWVALAKKSGPKSEKERREWLKDKHDLGSTTAWWIAEGSFDRGRDSIDENEYLKAAPGYVEAMYADRPNLRPIHDALIELARSIGSEVKFCPCQTIVPVYRDHVIAQIKPATKTRIDFGFALGDTKATGRLIDTGGFAKKDRITHRIPISDIKEINAEVKKWLKIAYERDGK
jgi:hypothetical protein